jgi:hypothetical protein
MVENVSDINQVLSQDSGAKNAKRSPSNKKSQKINLRETKEQSQQQLFSHEQ